MRLWLLALMTGLLLAAPAGVAAAAELFVTPDYGNQYDRFLFEGNGFLYKMVRMMVGALVGVGQGRLTREQIRGRLTAGRATAAPRLVAPAEGLVLVRVRY